MKIKKKGQKEIPKKLVIFASNHSIHSKFQNESGANLSIF